MAPLRWLPLLLLPLLALEPGAADVSALPERGFNFKLVDFGECEDEKGLRNRLENVTVERLNQTTLAVSGDFVVGETIRAEDGWEGQLLIQRQSGQDSRSRVTLLRHRALDMCAQIHCREYQSFLASLEGGVSRACPFEKGTFRMVKFALGLGSLQRSLREGTHYIRIAEKCKAGPVSCSQAVVEVERE